MHLLCEDIFKKKINNTFRYAKEEEKSPTYIRDGSSRSAPADAGELCSAALCCCAALRDQNYLCKWNSLLKSNF